MPDRKNANLFNAVERDLVENHRPLGISLFDFIERNNSTQADNIRNLWNRYFEDYPAELQAHLSKRFRSKEFVHHIAAAFELFLFTFFKRINYIVDASYETETRKTPDFRISQDGKKWTIVEATCVIPDYKYSFVEKVKNQIVEQLNREMQVGHFIVFPKFEGSFSAHPSVKSIVNDLIRHLRKWEDTLLADSTFQPAPFKLEYENLSITISTIKKLDDNNSVHRVVAPIWKTGEAELVNTDVHILESLLKKRRKYKKLDSKLIIAVYVIDTSVPDQEVIERTFFGKGNFEFRLEGENLIPIRNYRDGKGFWNEHRKEILGVLLFYNLGTVHLCDRKPEIYYNPYLNGPWDLSNIPFLTRFMPNTSDSVYDKIEAESYHKLMGLWDNWPFQIKE